MTTPRMQRVIYSLELELDAGPGPQTMVRICQLDRDGNSQYCYVLGKPRMIDVRPGDVIQTAGGRRKVIGVKAWRECYFAEGESPPKDGYLVRI